MSAKILIVDEDEDIREVIEILLSSEGYQVISAHNGEAALDLLNSNRNIDLIILDIILPGKSGFEICREIRKTTTIPILFLTAKNHVDDKRTGFMVGGDDYMSKPFYLIELVVRVKALVRRYAVYQGKDQNSSSDIIKIGDLYIHPTSREVKKTDKSISLRHMEYRLLVHLASNRGKIFTSQELYEAIWETSFLPISNNTVVAHIKNLRHKIEDNPKNPTYILTVWGKGYQICLK